MSQITHFYGVKCLAWKSGGVKFGQISCLLSTSDFYRHQEKFWQKVLILNCLDVDPVLLQLIYTAGLECRCYRDFTQFALWEARLHPLFLLFRDSYLKSTAIVNIFFYSSFTEEEQMQCWSYFMRSFTFIWNTYQDYQTSNNLVWPVSDKSLRVPNVAQEVR